MYPIELAERVCTRTKEIVGIVSDLRKENKVLKEGNVELPRKKGKSTVSSSLDDDAEVKVADAEMDESNKTLSHK